MRIEKGIPAPDERFKARSKYPWRLMEVGDCILFENEVGGTQSRAMRAARAYARYHGVKFVSRAEGTGFRIWRVE